MGAMQNNPKPKAKGNGARGSVRNDSRLEAFARSGPASGGDWGGCDPKWIQAVVEGITAMGGAVTFGLSRDMGAHALTLMLDGSRETLWFNGSADLDAELEGVVHVLKAIS